MIDTEKYRPARQNMKLHILARQADIFGINQFTSRKHILILQGENDQNTNYILVKRAEKGIGDIVSIWCPLSRPRSTLTVHSTRIRY